MLAHRFWAAKTGLHCWYKWQIAVRNVLWNFHYGIHLNSTISDATPLWSKCCLIHSDYNTYPISLFIRQSILQSKQYGKTPASLYQYLFGFSIFFSFLFCLIGAWPYSLFSSSLSIYRFSTILFYHFPFLIIFFLSFRSFPTFSNFFSHIISGFASFSVSFSLVSYFWSGEKSFGHFCRTEHTCYPNSPTASLKAIIVFSIHQINRKSTYYWRCNRRCSFFFTVDTHSACILVSHCYAIDATN